MTAIIEPSTVSGTVGAPPSKSLAQRAIAAAFLHKGTTTLKGIGDSGDERAALSVIRSFGADIEERGDELLIRSSGVISTGCREIQCGESGLAARLFTPIAASAGHAIRVSGGGTLSNRTMLPLITALRLFGVACESSGEFLPLLVKGPVNPGDAVLDGSAGSQVLSGFLFALSNVTKSPLAITVTNLQSRPYIDLTLDVLKKFGARIAHDNYRTFFIEPKHERLERINRIYEIEGDWSNAAFWIVAAAFCNTPLTISGLNVTSLQGDRLVLEIIRKAGIPFEWSAVGHLRVSGTGERRSFSADLAHTPDLFPILAVLAARCSGESQLDGLRRLRGKESDRVQSICGMLGILGVTSRIEADSLMIQGSDNFEGGEISSFGDHRIAMAAAVAGLVADSPVSITGAEAVAKSYPAFFTDMQSLGADVRQNPDP